MLPARLQDEGTRLAKQLEAAVSRIEQPGLREAALHYPRAGGKALRPALAAVTCEASGGRSEDADPLGLAVELLHTFSLVHDDLMDEDATRRGGPSVHEAYDDATAILAGDVLFALSFETLAELDQSPALPATVTALSRTARVLCEGQALDMAFETTWPTVETYETMIAKKTAALFACATGGAARIAGAPDATVDAMTTYGHELGMAFQVTDDVLDLAGDPARLGKPVGSDVRAGKKTHPVLTAHERAEASEVRDLERLLEGGADERGVQRVLELCETTGALEASQQATREHLGAARHALAVLEESDARGALDGLLDWLADRDR